MKISRLQPAVLLACLAACFTAAAIGALATRDAPGFYAALVQPPWAPPASLFGPVWTVLYASMAAAAWMAWRRRIFHAEPALGVLFVLQLALNAMWSWLFFHWHLGLPALIDILALVALVAWLVLRFWPLSRPASILLWPYLLWICFAAALNFSLWRQNPALLQ